MRLFILALVLAVYTIPVTQSAISVDGSCASGVECPAGSCCSVWGFCGVGPSFCNSNSGGNNPDNRGGNNPDNRGGNNPDNRGSDRGQAPDSQQPGGHHPNTSTDQPNNAGNTSQQPRATTSSTVSAVPPTSTPTTKPSSNVGTIKPLSAISIAILMLAGYFSN